MKSEREHIIEEALLNGLRQGKLSRRTFMQTLMMAGMGLSGVSALGARPILAQESRPLTPTFYQWIVNLHPGIPEVNEAFEGLNFQIAPVEGFNVARFVAEAAEESSTWDVYVGMTPFVEMASLIEAGVIEPWDDYIPQEVLDDIIPSIREECTVDGRLYSWPFLLDVIVQGWNSNLISAAGLTDTPAATWDEFLGNAQTIVDSGAARYGAGFDAHGWRSLAPITHSFSTDAYYQLGDNPVPLFDFTNDAAIEALQVMKQIYDLSAPNLLQPGATDGGVNNTPDEVAFASESLAYLVKYQNAHFQWSANWPDPSAVRLAALPSGGADATVFWTTGACLFRYGQNKEQAAEYMASLTYNENIWRDSIAGTETGHVGQMPPYASVWAGWAEEQPDWIQEQTWVPLVREQLDAAKAIPNHAFGLQQFFIGQPEWERYLTGEESDPMVAMQAAKDAVAAQVEASA